MCDLNVFFICFWQKLIPTGLVSISANHEEASLVVKKSQGIVSVHIADAPDLTMRAVLLDLNPYGRVPTMVHVKSSFSNPS